MSTRAENIKALDAALAEASHDEGVDFLPQSDTTTPWKFYEKEDAHGVPHRLPVGANGITVFARVPDES